MNILNILNKDKDIYSYEYYGLNDIATGFDINVLIEEKDEIIKYFDQRENLINNYDDFIDYLFVRKNIKIEELSVHIKIEVKDSFEKVINIMKDYYKKISNRNLINYMNSNISFLLSEKNRYLHEQVFKMAFNYHSGCNLIIIELINKKFYLILRHFEDIKKIINLNEEYIKRVLDVERFNEVKTYSLKEYLEMIVYYKKSHENLNYLITPIIEEIIKYKSQLYEILNEDNIIEYDHVIKQIYDFLVSIGHKEANVIEEKEHVLDELRNKYLKKHGREFSYEIPIVEFRKTLDKENIDPISKLIMLTHTMDKSSKEFKSIYARIGKEKEKHFVDMCSTTIPHDDYFTITKQQWLNISDSIYLELFQYFICEKRIKEFISLLISELAEICKYYEIEYEDLKCDFDILLNNYSMLFEAYKADNEYLIMGLNYGLVLFQCGIIEKLLRNLYKSQQKESYISNDGLSLGTLLDAKNEIMLRFFDENDLRIFRYYLIDGRNGEVGMNYRNNFAHYINLKPTDMDFGKTIKVTHILTTIINNLILTIK